MNKEYLENVSSEAVVKYTQFTKLKSINEAQAQHKIKVCLVSDYAYPSGGVEVFIDEIINSTNDYIDYRLLTWQPSEGTTKRKEVTETIRIDCGNYAMVWEQLLWADIVFLQTSFNVRILASITADFCKTQNIPLISVIHTSSNTQQRIDFKELQSKIFGKVLENSDKVVCVSQSVIENVAKLFDKLSIDKSKLIKIENGSRFKNVNKRESSKNKRTVTFIGRPTRAKGIDVFVNLIRDLQNYDIDFIVNTVSMPLPDEYDDIREFASAMSSLNQEEMENLYCDTDLLVVPYRYADGLPLTVLEALSFQVPIIGFKSEGVEELLRKNNQLLVEIDDYEELKRLVEKWINSEIAIKIPTKTDVEDWSTQSEKYLKIFQTI